MFEKQSNNCEISIKFYLIEQKKIVIKEIRICIALEIYKHVIYV